MIRLQIVGFFMALSSAAVLAQEGGGIKWGLNVEQAIEEAKKVDRPLMFWVQRSSNQQENKEQNMERDQKRAFADPRVVEISKRFVPAKLSASRYKELLAKWNVRAGANLDIIFISPAGEFLDDLSPNSATRGDTLALKMATVFRGYRDKIFEKDVKPVLEGEKSSAKELKAALERIDSLTILSADESVIKLLKRESLDESVAAKALLVLGELSTKPAVKELFDRAQNDKRAFQALEKCNAGAADVLLAHMEGETNEQFVLAYNSLCKICKVGNQKPDRFWEGKVAKVKEDEIKRVKDLATKAANRWRERNEEYR